MLERALDGLGQILQQVEAVSYLDGLRCSLRGPLRVAAGAITADELDGRMSREPGCKCLGLAVGEEIGYESLLNVDENRAVRVTFSPRPVVDAHGS
jgi:hypothetical protein